MHLPLQVHCVWAAAEAYSAPSIVLTSRSHDGLHVFDDFREAYAWLRHNTDVDDKVSSLVFFLIDFKHIVFSSFGISLGNQSDGQEVFLDSHTFLE